MNTAAVILKKYNHVRVAVLADAFAIGTAISLPWSTSATSILVVLWLLATVPFIELAGLRRILSVPAASFPVLLVLLAVVGMLWADISLNERIGGIATFLKLLVIPLLMLQFSISDAGSRVLAGFMISCMLLLALSFATIIIPEFPWRSNEYGVPVKDHISQSELFGICVFGAINYALVFWKRSRLLSLACLMVGLLFLLNIVFVSTARTTLVILPFMVCILGLRLAGVRGLICGVVIVSIVAAAAWFSSPYLRKRVIGVVTETELYNTTGANTSSGERIEFWKRSIAIIKDAPMIGHGTGSISHMFRVTSPNPAIERTTNPHNQIFAIGIQLGFVGIVVLLAMWIAHFRLFWESEIAWMGLIVVTQNAVGSLFNSHLFDFTHGWTYVWAIGIIGGMMLRLKSSRYK